LQFALYQRFYYRVVHGLAWAEAEADTVPPTALTVLIVPRDKAWLTVRLLLTDSQHIMAKAVTPDVPADHMA